MKLTSPAFFHGGMIPSRFTCEGKNHNPELHFVEVPQATKSLALIIEDPDVPAFVRKDQMWDHWILFNIPGEIRKLEEGLLHPPGIQGKSTGRKIGYEGPCPPDREHRYFFKLFALDIILDLSQGATKKELMLAMQGHVMAESVLMGRYQKKKPVKISE